MAQTEEYKERYKKLSQIDKALDVMYQCWWYLPSYYDEYCLRETALADIRKDLEEERNYLNENRESMSRKEIKKAEQQIGNNEYKEVIYNTKYEMFAKFIVDDVRSLKNEDFDSLHTDVFSHGYLNGAISKSDILRFSHAESENTKKARQVLDDVMYDDGESAHSKGEIIYSVCLIQARYDGFTKAFNKRPSDRFLKNSPNKPADERER